MYLTTRREEKTVLRKFLVFLPQQSTLFFVVGIKKFQDFQRRDIFLPLTFVQSWAGLINALPIRKQAYPYNEAILNALIGLLSYYSCNYGVSYQLQNTTCPKLTDLHFYWIEPRRQFCSSLAAWYVHNVTFQEQLNTICVRKNSALWVTTIVLWCSRLLIYKVLFRITDPLPMVELGTSDLGSVCSTVVRVSAYQFGGSGFAICILQFLFST